MWLNDWELKTDIKEHNSSIELLKSIYFCYYLNGIFPPET